MPLGNNMQTISFNIHGKLKLTAKTEKRSYYRIIKRLKVEYGFFTMDDCYTEPDICITIGSINKLPSDYVRIDNKYFIGDNWIYSSDSYKVAKWKVYIEGLESDNINMYIEPNFFACDLIPPIIVTPLIAFQLLKKGFSLVHAAGISDGNNATLLTGFGGSGKTLNALRALGEGLKLLGDDHVILDKGKALSFPTAISLFKYNMPNGDWFARWKAEVELKSLIYGLSLGYIYPVTKVPIEEVFSNSIAQSSDLQRIILLEPQFNEEHIVIQEMEKDEFIESWVKNILLDSIHFYKYLLAYSYVNPRFFNYLNEVKESLLRNLGGCKRFIKICYPQHKKEDLFNQIRSIMKVKYDDLQF